MEADQISANEKESSAASPPQTSLIRRTLINRRTALCTMLLAADTARVTWNAENLQPFTNDDSTHEKGLPDPSLPILEVMRRLETDEMALKFLETNATYALPNGVCGFLWRYCQSPESFRRCNWVGPCNHYSEFMSMWGALHGKKMHVITLRPNIDCATNHWHSIAAYRRTPQVSTDKEYVVYDNDKKYQFDSLEEYAEGRKMTIPPIIGKVRWHLRNDDPRTKLLRHVLDSVDELEMTEEPLLPAVNQHFLASHF